MAYTHAKVQGQRSVGSKDRVKTNGWTDRWREVTALPPMLTWLVTRFYSTYSNFVDVNNNVKYKLA